MKILESKGLLLIAGIALLALTGCGQVEETANAALEKAKQSALQALDEAQQSGTIDQARESADQVLQQARQQASGLLGQASEFLSEQQQKLEGQDDQPANPEEALIAL